MPITHTFVNPKADGADATITRPSDWNAAHSGASGGGVYSYPSTFTGDSEDMTSTANWADVVAFDTKEILNSTILHLRTQGASKDQQVRKTLGTTKAGAFEFRTVLMPDLDFWSVAFDMYGEFRLTDSGGTVIAVARVGRVLTGGSRGQLELRVGTTAVVTSNLANDIPYGSPITLRIARDGSNVLSFQYGLGHQPLALYTVKMTADAQNYGPTSSGTVARAEYALHTPASVNAGASIHLYIDTFESL